MRSNVETAGFRIWLAAGVILAAMVIAGTGPASAEMSGAMRLAMLEPAPLADITEPPSEKVVVRVDLSDQRMYVYVAEKLEYTFPVSTGRKGYGTPVGRYQAQWLSPKHRSRKYNMAPMPWSVFFHGGYAIHGTTELKRLGRTASHGCVRLHPDNAKVIYSLVRATGKDSTLITIVR
jgi:hypothetical protein